MQNIYVNLKIEKNRNFDVLEISRKFRLSTKIPGQIFGPPPRTNTTFSWGVSGEICQILKVTLSPLFWQFWRKMPQISRHFYTLKLHFSRKMLVPGQNCRVSRGKFPRNFPGVATSSKNRPKSSKFWTKFHGKKILFRGEFTPQTPLVTLACTRVKIVIFRGRRENQEK